MVKPIEPNEHLDELLRLLRATYRRAQEPAYREIAAQCRRRISASTISRIFNADKPPKWRNLEILLNTLGVEPDELESVWYPLWARAQNKVNPIDQPDRPLRRLIARPADRICGECGAVIGDARAHQAWHARLGRPAGKAEPGLRTMTTSARGSRRRVPTVPLS
ncbi:helix-turn-helix transcriptional regulator [Asanoa sp. WMMD1127]|uniref:helix-turn-helix domain-containing protein n=1 Tax=Asanoa sp. WMMD1127 TaxID=3016107 RepID=UPI0024164F25|nr:helix-turn-helix transcriptional regulator [Asanoa sp. WMMD1127]MDG4822877.1 helix-turn-helix transcriptional regulator [Asanoa sp. WMMD1127]